MGIESMTNGDLAKLVCVHKGDPDTISRGLKLELFPCAPVPNTDVDFPAYEYRVGGSLLYVELDRKGIKIVRLLIRKASLPKDGEADRER